jgi:hypothetical protein
MRISMLKNGLFLAGAITHVIPELVKLKQEEHKFKTKLGYIARPYLNPSIN